MDVDNLILLPGGLITKNHPEVLRAVEGSLGYYSRPYLKQFSSPDSLIPDPYNSLDYNRYDYARSNPLKYTDPSGHFVVFVVAGVAIDMVAVALIGAVTLSIAHNVLPGRQERIKATASALGYIGEQAQSGLNALFAKQKTPKPLTPDEKGKVDHLEKDLDGFTQDHPDLSDEAQKKANGEDLEYDHVKEAEQYMRGVEKDMEHLQDVYNHRTEEAQAAINSAIERGQAWLKRMREILGQ